jgi:hypothetical protein
MKTDANRNGGPARPRDEIPAAVWQALADGWLPGPPDDLPDDLLLVDKFEAAALLCEKCGRGGGQYWAVHRLVPPGYKAWSCCRGCGHATEL